MVAGAIAQGIYTAGKLIFRYRKQIYAVVSAQDRYIKGAFVGTRVSKAAQYGWRSGAAAGSLIGTYITNDAPETPGNGIQKPVHVPTPSTSYKTRRRPTRRISNRYCIRQRPYRSKRRSRFS